MKKPFLTLLVAIGVMTSLPSFAENPFENPFTPKKPVDAPIDGGLSVLIAAGVGYGIKKVYNKRKTNAVD